MKNFLDYIQGERKGKKAHDLEREAMQDPFLQDALDGYDEVEGKHTDNITRLQKKITGQTQKKKKSPIYWYAAAVVLLFISVGGFLVLQNQGNKKGNEIVYQEEVSKEDNHFSLEEKSEETVPLNEELLKNKEKKSSEISKTKHLEQPSLAYKDNSIYLKHRIASESEKLELHREESLEGKIMFNEMLRSSEEPSVTNKSSYMNEDTSMLSDKIDDKDLLAMSTKNRDLERIEESSKHLAGNISSDKRRSKKESANKKSQADIGVAMGSLKVQMNNLVSVPVIGIDNYNLYLEKEMSLLKEDGCSKAKGTAIIKFTVDSKGKPQDIKVIKSLCNTIDLRLIELIKKGSDWTEGEGQIQFNQ